jgi:hypothetical protein
MAISILAIDFPSFFPRKLCKTEEYGISYVMNRVFYSLIRLMLVLL